MKLYILLFGFFISFSAIAQESQKEKLKDEKAATDLVYSGNELIGEENHIEAEMAYRKAISKAPTKAVGSYNLAHSYIKSGSLEEALFRSEEAAQNAKSKDEKHRIYHNIGNILMEKELCKEAVEAFKNALRNDPTDEETRYNFALAKECAEQQKQDGGGEDDKKDDNKEEEKDKEEEQKKEDEKKDEEKDKKDEGDKDKKEGDKEEDDKGKPQEDKKDDGKGDKDKKNPNQKPKPQPGQMSPQQMKNILEAMQNQEQKVQQKINAEKQKGAKVKTGKDW